MKKITFLSALLVAGAFVFSANADNFGGKTDIHLISMDQTTVATIPAAQIGQDYRVDELYNFLYIWSATYTANSPTGPNSNGVVGTGNYVSLTVADKGWSGFGYSSEITFKDMSAITRDYVFHMAIKSTSQVSQALIIGGNGEIKTTLGSTPFLDGENQVPLPIVADFAKNGEWQIIEIPMGVFFDLGLSYSGGPVKNNAVAFLSGGVAGTKIDVDAIYFYKPQVYGVGVNDVKAEKLNVLVSSKTLEVVGATEPVELYSITGAKVKVSNNGIMGIEDLNTGIYIVRCGGLAQKVQIK